ncbi:dTDP-4-amino-4,6-dideoxygalactose transaminase [Sinosporangium album]|uniref:dTDP-4-amino-4,6-dideoxygalactose transaminase n=1 Tax=Sinosporangium album TaxID=504805 RepID=A0A1G8C275_9ACTN|nr:DegT/DnrJ/EryC1/StrS family aminotransferase [Sinosporangium album]SDH39587.1 dTDP-4-amino-4,6-dideoxygalactose transaminase [Sinosporangium album]
MSAGHLTAAPGDEGRGRTPEALIADRTGRHCVYLPSNRLGLYLALRHWCTPGQRVLMSPISADEILFLVIAAGLRPVIAPLSPATGNIDTSRANIGAVDAVLTTNLYGLPDDMRAFTGKILIEDVAHAIETTVDGRPLGTFGAAGVYSLSKHAAAGSGGVLAVADAADAKALAAERDRLLMPGSGGRELLSVVTSMARHAAVKLNLVRPALWLSRLLGMEEKREGYRIALRADELRAALPQAPALRPFASWIQADLHDFQARRGAIARWYQGRKVAALPRQREARLAGVRLLATLPSVAKGVRAHLDQPLFRVPLLVEDRDRAIAELEGRGVPIGFLYDPPYDDYAPGFAEPSPSPQRARWWGAHALPIDPVYAHRAMPVLEGLTPTTPPP